MRFLRSDRLDDLPSSDPALRVDVLRDLVDRLPEPGRHLVERTTFGGATLVEAAAEVGIGEKTARLRIEEALEVLKKGLFDERDAVSKVLEDHTLGALFATFLDEERHKAL